MNISIDKHGNEMITQDYLHKELSDVKVEIIKWVVILILSQTVLLAGLIKLFT